MLLSVVHFIDQGFSKDQEGVTERLKCEIDRKGQINFPFHCVQHKMDLTVNGSKSFCTPELIFQSPSYGHRAIRQRLDLWVFFK